MDIFRRDSPFVHLRRWLPYKANSIAFNFIRGERNSLKKRLRVPKRDHGSDQPSRNDHIDGLEGDNSRRFSCKGTKK